MGKSKRHHFTSLLPFRAQKEAAKKKKTKKHAKMTTLKKQHNKRMKRRRRLLVLFVLFLLFLFVFFLQRGTETLSYLQRFLIRDPGEDPYEHNSMSRGDVCEDRGFHYDGLSFLDPHKTRLSGTDFEKYEREKNLFQSALCHHQFKTKFDDMRATNAKPLVYADDDPTAGFGSRVLRVCSAFFASVHFGRPFAYAKVGRWTYSKCASRGNDCYFQKITSARTEYETPEGVYRGEGALVKEEEKDEELIWTRGSLDGFQKEHNAGIGWMKDLKKALNGFEMPSGRGGCWVVSQFLYYILHPNEKLDRVLRLEKKRMGWETEERREPVAAIHVRHGDRAQRGHQGSNLQIEQFLARLRKLDPKCKKVLLMTEDGEVIDDAIKNFGKEFHFYYTTIQPRHNDDINRLLKEGKLDPENEIHNALVNLYLAADADYFLGHLSSTWGRVVLLLSYGKYGCFQKMDLMESTWKSRWGFSACSTEEWEKEAKKFECRN